MKNIRIGIISSSFRPEVVNHLEKRCQAALEKKGVPKTCVEIFRVPGALEIPLLAKKLAKLGKYHALIAFGAIVKGDTYHFEQISNECARGCMQVALDFEIPVIFEVLPVYKLSDALARAQRGKENKGVEAATTALAMIKLLRQFK